MDLYHSYYQLLPSGILIEKYLAENYFHYIVGVHSSVLIFAKQIYGNQSEVISFGLAMLKFKNPRIREKIYELYDKLGIATL